ncbi:MAG: phosphoglucosamine mutase [Thermoanaerobaculales bacterium]|nr:phosphoglucosamine mutase [Thermoanaerobaculales bacterium]
MKRQLFGTDGIRGRAFEPPLDENTVRRLGFTLARLMTGDGGPSNILLAGDTRRSTESLARWLGSGIQTGGGQVTWGGVLPTPAVSHLLRGGNWTAGVVISASHNPAQDNGIKVLTRSGEKVTQRVEQEIEINLEKASVPAEIDLPRLSTGLLTPYRRSLMDSVGNERPLAGLKLVLDAAHGAASGLADEMLSELGAEIISIASSPNGANINEGVGAAHPRALTMAVTENHADGGLALDGDADRAILVDEKGRILDGDDILLAWARGLRAEGHLHGDRVVATVMSNFGLEIALEREGVSLLRCPVGDRAVWETMVENNAVLGGEQSGHIICSHHGVTGDGLLTGIHLLSLANSSNRPLSELSGLERMPQVLLNVKVGKRQPFEDLAEVQTVLARTEEKLRGCGRVLLRYSGTEPLARVMLEGENDTEIQELAEELAEAIRRALPE